MNLHVRPHIVFWISGDGVDHCRHFVDFDAAEAAFERLLKDRTIRRLDLFRYLSHPARYAAPDAEAAILAGSLAAQRRRKREAEEGAVAAASRLVSEAEKNAGALEAARRLLAEKGLDARLPVDGEVPIGSSASTVEVAAGTPEPPERQPTSGPAAACAVQADPTPELPLSDEEAAEHFGRRRRGPSSSHS